MQDHEMDKWRTLVLGAMFIDLFKFCYVLAHFIFPVCLIRYVLCISNRYDCRLLINIFEVSIINILKQRADLES